MTNQTTKTWDSYKSDKNLKQLFDFPTGVSPPPATLKSETSFPSDSLIDCLQQNTETTTQC